jgi:putative tricarboxylic transport membrane protein
MELFQNLIRGFEVALVPINVLYCFIGCLLGTIVGVLPGIANVGTMALLLPITYYFNDAGAIMLLAGIYYGAQYGGSTTSILLNIPGEPTAIMTSLDGYQMHKKGRGGAALGISAFGSFIAGTAGIIGVTLFAPTLVEWALEFGSPEYFSLAVLGLTLVSYLAHGSILKAIMMAVVGMLAATVGLDPVRSIPRYYFGTAYLMGGLELVVIALGMFALDEAFNTIADPSGPEETIKPPKKLREMLPNRQEWGDSVMPILRGSLIGFLVGLLPGGGGIIATIASYGIEKKMSKHPERFGTGEIAGVAGPESANNSSTAGAMIPLMTLGIPSNVNVALLLGALMMHGITPGPMFMKTRPDVFWGVIASVYIGNIMLLVLNLPLIGLFTKIAFVPSTVLTPIVIFFCLTGAYLTNNNTLDIILMLVFGVFSFLFRRYGFPPAPFILGFILGPMLETALRQSLIGSKGSFALFFTRPISCSLLIVAMLIWVIPFFMKRLKRSPA